jgi:hypothetical protein
VLGGDGVPCRVMILQNEMTLEEMVRKASCENMRRDKHCVRK